MFAQVRVSHKDLIASGLTEEQLAAAIANAIASGLRHPVTGAPLNWPTAPVVDVRDDRPPVTIY